MPATPLRQDQTKNSKLSRPNKITTKTKTHSFGNILPNFILLLFKLIIAIVNFFGIQYESLTDLTIKVTMVYCYL